MKNYKQKVLLTGDDGYNSLGTRVLIHHLKNYFDLAIAGTLTQQSGVGGHKHIMGGGAWGKDTVDGIKALWLDGSPVDAMEAARMYYTYPFDYCISGINWGPNIDGCLYSSGTFSAAYYAKTLGVAKKCIAISWDLPVKHHFTRHGKKDEIDEFITYPGAVARSVLLLAIQKNLWGADIININLPTQVSNIIEFATPLTSIHGFWPTVQLDTKTHQFSYNHGERGIGMGLKTSEAQVLERNNISIVPCQGTMFDNNIYRKISTKKISL